MGTFCARKNVMFFSNLLRSNITLKNFDISIVFQRYILFKIRDIGRFS